LRLRFLDAALQVLLLGIPPKGVSNTSELKKRLEM
jgi:hypothetical protein